MPPVLITPPALYELAGRHIELLREAGFDVRYPQAGCDVMQPAVLAEQLARSGCEAVIAGGEGYTADILGGSRLRVIARAGVGFDAVDLGAACARRVVVTITPGTNDHAVAEHTLALILAVGRGIVRRDREVRGGGWPRWPLPPVRGKTLGIVGLGRIGKALVPRAQACGLRIVAFEPYPDGEFVTTHAVQLLTLDELLAESDYVSLHVPLAPQTAGLINRTTLGRMKKGAILVNTARGGLVVEEDLLEALRSGHVAGAGLDVFVNEPPVGSPLLELENVVLTPHVAGVDDLSLAMMAEKAAAAIAELYAGGWPEGCVVNPEVRAGWRW